MCFCFVFVFFCGQDELEFCYTMLHILFFLGCLCDFFVLFKSKLKKENKASARDAFGFSYCSTSGIRK